MGNEIEKFLEWLTANGYAVCKLHKNYSWYPQEEDQLSPITDEDLISKFLEAMRREQLK